MWPALWMQRLGQSWYLSCVALDRQDLSKDATLSWGGESTAAILFLTSSSLEFLGGFVGIEIKCDEVDEGKKNYMMK